MPQKGLDTTKTNPNQPSGFIFIHRKFFYSKAWLEPRVFSEAEAWIWLIQRARFADCVENGEKIERGCLPFTQRELANKFKWSRKKLNRFLRDLERDHQMHHQKHHQKSQIKIVNYDTYQRFAPPKEPPKAPPKGPSNKEGSNKEGSKGGSDAFAPPPPPQIDPSFLQDYGRDEAEYWAAQARIRWQAKTFRAKFPIFDGAMRQLRIWAIEDGKVWDAKGKCYRRAKAGAPDAAREAQPVSRGFKTSTPAWMTEDQAPASPEAVKKFKEGIADLAAKKSIKGGL